MKCIINKPNQQIGTDWKKLFEESKTEKGLVSNKRKPSKTKESNREVSEAEPMDSES